jgi:hypothetical protein
MRINSIDNRGYVTIVAQEAGPDRSLRISVTASYKGFSGKYASIWISHDALDAFVDGLASLDRIRRGDACLESMSPNEFVLRLFSTDSLGHIALSILLKRPTYEFGKCRCLNLELTFELNASRMSQIIYDVKNLKK